MDRNCLYLTRASLYSSKAHVTFALKMADALIQTGRSLTFVYPFQWENLTLTSNQLKADYGLNNRIPLRSLPSLDLPVVKNYFPRLWFWSYTTTYLLCLLPYLFLKKLARQNYFIYTTDFPIALALSYLKHKGFSIPIFFEVHDVPNSFTNYRKNWLKQIDGFIVNGEGVQQKLLDEGFDKNKIQVAYNGINLEDYRIETPKEELRERLDLPKNDYLAVFTGNPYDYNGIQTILSMAERTSEITFLCVGGKMDRVRELRGSLTPSQKNNIILRNHKPASEMPAYQKCADCLLAPLTGKLDRTEYYATPMKIFEYFAAGRVIVASDLPSLRYLLEDEKTALLCDPEDPNDFLRSIERIRNNPSLEQSMVDATRNQAKKYTWSRRVEQVNSFLKTILQKF